MDYVAFLFYWGIFYKLICLIIGLIFFKKLSSNYRYLVFYIFLGIITECLGRYFGHIRHQNNLWLSSIYNLFAFILLFVVGKSFIVKSVYQKIFLGFFVIGILLWTLDISVHGMSKLLTWFSLYEYSYLLMLYLTVLFTNTLFGEKRLMELPLFWICLSMVILFSICLPYWGMFNYINEHHPELTIKLFNIKLIANSISYPMIGYSFYLIGKQSKHGVAKV